MTWVDETGSTNADLLAQARAGSAHGAVLVTDHQTAGRGRLGRTWVAPPRSGLLCSILLRPAHGATPQGAAWAVGLAARQACRAVAGVEPELKWPNDLMIGDRKLAGVLAETVAEGATTSAVVVGIGLNVGWTSAPPPDVAARAVTLAEAAGRPVDRAELLRELLSALAPLDALWLADPRALATRYRAELATLGRRVRVELVDRILEGTATAVTDDGALVLRADDEREQALHVGDVVHLRDRLRDRWSGSPAG